MELRQLRYFVAVAETGSINRAARKIFLTQPALSRQIKSLEDSIGIALLKREAHSMSLTQAGETLLQEARSLIRQADLALERVRSCGQGVRLRVGYAPSFATGLLSSAVESFSQKHKDAKVELLDLSSQEMINGLEGGTLDVAITAAPEREFRGLRWTPLSTLSWQLAVSLQHPLSTLTKVSPADAIREPFVVFCQRDYPEYWTLVTTWFREHGTRPAIAGQYDGVTSLLAAVESKLGVAIVTTGTSELIPKRVKLIPLSAAPKSLAIAAGYREDLAADKSVAVFIEELRLAAQAHAE